MTASEVFPLVLATLLGFLLGAFFFGGLWWTVRNGLSSQMPALWFFGSSLLRMSIALTGLYFVSGGRWERLLLTLVGFVIARLVVVGLSRSWEESQTNRLPDSSHAP